MSKRRVSPSPLVDTLRAHTKAAKRQRDSILPRGFIFTTKDGTLYVKNLSTGEEVAFGG